MIRNYHQQLNQQLQHDKRSRLCDFEIRETIMTRNYRGTLKWLTGIILKICVPLTYQVKKDSALIWRRYVDQLHAASPDTSNKSANAESLTNNEGSLYFQWLSFCFSTHKNYYTSGTLLIHKVAIWNSLCTCYFPEDYTLGDTLCLLLH